MGHFLFHYEKVTVHTRVLCWSCDKGAEVCLLRETLYRLVYLYYGLPVTRLNEEGT